MQASVALVHSSERYDLNRELNLSQLAAGQAIIDLLARVQPKTYQGWEDGPEMPIDEYIQPGDEVDEEMVNHFGGVVSPQYCTYQFTQVGEASHEERGRYFYQTFGRFGDRYLYLGVLPPFKQPKY
jgi:hypothetical protein